MLHATAASATFREKPGMNSAVLDSAATVHVTPSGRGIGADVSGIDLAQPLAEGQIRAIKNAW
jgi:hypothetical protein